MNRRSMVAGLACLSASFPASARDIGVRGRAELMDALETMRGISMGSGPTIHIVVAPNCPKATDMWDAAFSAADRVRVRWVPVGSGYADDQVVVSRCLAVGTPGAVRQLLHGEASGEATEQSNAAAAAQQHLYTDTVERMMWEATGRAPAVPTLVFADRGMNARVIRGAIGWEKFPEVFASMGI